MLLSGSQERDDGPATSIKPVGLGTAGIGVAAVPDRGKAMRWDCCGAMGSGSLCSPAARQVSQRDSLQAFFLKFSETLFFEKYFYFDKLTKYAHKSPVFLEIFQPALKCCQVGFILTFWIKFANVASASDA